MSYKVNLTTSHCEAHLFWQYLYDHYFAYEVTLVMHTIQKRGFGGLFPFEVLFGISS